MESESVDSVVVDPPYGLSAPPDIAEVLRHWLAGDEYATNSRGFMGKAWDAFVPGPVVWREVCRVLKPGGHVVCFAGQRTVDLMGIALRLGGFEVRDTGGWLTWQGFPKSLDIGKAIDKQRHDREQVLEVTAWIREARDRAGITNRDIDAAFGTNGMAGHWTSGASQPAVPTLEQVPTLLALLNTDPPANVRRLLLDLNGRKGAPGEAFGLREVLSIEPGRGASSGVFGDFTDGDYARTAPATDAARRWSGFGTALKPAIEPWILARKPFPGTVAENVTRYGTGALNIDGCRYPQGDPAWPGPQENEPETHAASAAARAGSFGGYGASIPGQSAAQSLGRWPANLYACPKASRAEREAGCENLPARSGAENVGRVEGSAGTKSPRAGAGRAVKGGTGFRLRPDLPAEKAAWVIEELRRSGVPEARIESLLRQKRG